MLGAYIVNTISKDCIYLLMHYLHINYIIMSLKQLLGNFSSDVYDQ